MAKRSKAAYMISAVAEQYQIHPQTLRLYEREGLAEAVAQRRQYAALYRSGPGAAGSDSQADARFGRESGGVEIILNMRERMAEMQRQIEQFVSSLNDEISQRSRQTVPEPAYSLIPVIEARRPKK